jgi:hypothetical protein
MNLMQDLPAGWVNPNTGHHERNQHVDDAVPGKFWNEIENQFFEATQVAFCAH